MLDNDIDQKHTDKLATAIRADIHSFIKEHKEEYEAFIVKENSKDSMEENQ